MTPKPVKLAFYLKTDRSISSELLRASLSIVDIAGDGPRNTDETTLIGKRFLRLGGLEVSAQIGRVSPGPNERETFYGWEVRFKDLYLIGVREAKQIIETLTFINRGLSKLDTQFGNAKSFSEYLTRIASVLKIAYVIERKNPNDKGFYGDIEDFKVLDLSAARYHIDRIEHCWATTGKTLDATCGAVTA